MTERLYFCRECGREVENPAGSVPDGWLGLTEYTGDAEERPRRRGIYCSLGCLGAAVEHMRTTTRIEGG